MTKFRNAALALAGVLAITAATATDASAQWRRHHWGGWGWGDYYCQEGYRRVPCTRY